MDSPLSKHDDDRIVCVLKKKIFTHQKEMEKGKSTSNQSFPTCL